MNDYDWAVWIASYRQHMLRADEQYDFVVGWRQSLDRFPLDVAMEAVRRLVADPRIAERGSPASFPQKQLPLILEHARAIAEDRERRARKPIAWGDKPPIPEFWDAGLLKMGVIQKHEFAKRKREREAVK